MVLLFLQTATCLQCFDTAGWRTRKASGLQKRRVGIIVVLIKLQLCTSFSSGRNHHHLVLHYNPERFDALGTGLPILSLNTTCVCVCVCVDNHQTAAAYMPTTVLRRFIPSLHSGSKYHRRPVKIIHAITVETLYVITARAIPDEHERTNYEFVPLRRLHPCIRQSLNLRLRLRRLWIL